MFRRKEDSLFDTATDANPSTAEAAPASTVTTQPAAAANTASIVNRPASDPRPNTANAPAAAPSAFRPASAPLSGDMSRNRMPEVKPATATPAANMTIADKNKPVPGRRVLTVGNDILLKGEIATCDRLVIEGKVDATLNDVHTVEIAETGSFKGSAHIEDAEISGLFEGDLIVRNRLIIYATGKVRGKITYGEIEIERGGEMTGEIKTSNQTQGSAARPRVEKKEAVA
jgi:cytoskeletal protein CcmA (bactofilin family)